jgi:hypothetical protein
MVRSDTDQWDIVSSVGHTALVFTLVDENGWAPARPNSGSVLRSSSLTQTKAIRCYENRAAPIESTNELAITDTKGLKRKAGEPGCDRSFRLAGCPEGHRSIQQRAPGKRDQEATRVAYIIIQGR